MKLKLIGLTGLLMGSVSLSAAPLQDTTPAAGTKIAFVNTTAVLQGTAEGKKELAALEQYITSQQSALESQQSELDTLRRQYDSQVRMLNPDTAAEMQRTINEKDRKLRRGQEDIELDINRRRETLLNRMSDKIQLVIADFAEQKGLGAVFLQTPSLPFFSPPLDITADIIKLYDEKNPVAQGAPGGQ